MTGHEASDGGTGRRGSLAGPAKGRALPRRGSGGAGLGWRGQAAWLSVAWFLAACAATAVAGDAEAAPRRNVLLIAVDDLNADLGCYGHPLVKSPSIDRLARRGVRFLNAYCQYPVCNPSRSSFLTGLYPEQTGVLSNAGDFRKKLPDVVTLPQLFMRQGYFVARVGKIFHYGVPNQIGTAGKDDPASWQETVNPRGIDREVHDRIHTLQPGQFGGTLSWLRLDSEDGAHTDGIGATAAIALLEAHRPEKTGKPFFLAVGFYRPHTPYVAPSKYFDLYPVESIEPEMEIPGDRDDIPLAALADRPKQRELSVAQRKEIIQAYYASISFMDAQVGRLLDAVDRLRLAETTAIVLVSDHGYHLGRHGLWQKGDLFEGSCRAPLIIAEPGNPNAGKAAEAIVEFVDIYPTVAELCGLDRPSHLAGESLVPILRDVGRPGKAAALTVSWSRAASMHPELRGKRILGATIRTPRFRYTEWGGGEYGVELYDYRTDPVERKNLAGDPAHRETAARMKRLLEEARRRAGAEVGSKTAKGKEGR
ncbi:MAG: sulfatase [Planctomycetes bacterium]|nr:sulfatase [Planctomycetota bacterium]